MLYRRFLLVASLLVLALVPGVALAADSRQGVNIYVGPNEVVNGDLHAAGGVVDIEGTVRGNVFAGGASVIVPGVVTGDLNAVGGMVTIPGTVEGEVRAVGATVTINGTIGQDVSISGGSLSIGPRAQVAQDVLIVGQSASVDGKVGKNLQAYVNDLTIGGPIVGNVRGIVGTLQLTSDAVIGGDLIYTSAQDASVAPGAVVRGTVQRHPLPTGLNEIERTVVTSQISVSWPGTEVGIYLMGLVYVLLFPTFARLSIGAIWRGTWKSLWLGLVLLINVPILALLLFILGLSIGGWWLGFILLGLYGTALLLAYISTALFIGNWLFALTARSSVNLAVVLLVGLVALTLLCMLPIVGGVIRFVALVFGLGALGVAAIQERRAPRRSFEP